MALDSVKKLGKLSEFDNSFDLSTFAEDIAYSQFVEEGLSNSGAFTPNVALNDEDVSAELRKHMCVIQYFFIMTLNIYFFNK